MDEKTPTSTEQSYAFPTQTKFFYLKNRSSYTIQYTYTALGSGTTYRTLDAYQEICINSVTLGSTTLYFQSPGAGGILEIESWA